MRSEEVSTHQYKRIWKSSGFAFFLITIVIFMGVSVTREVLRRLEIRHEVNTLKSDVARLEQRNAGLGDIIALLNTSTVQDKEARMKLGMQAPGEQVVLFTDRDASSKVALPDSDTIRYIPIRDYQSNPEKWFSYFWDKLQTAYTL